MDDSIQFFFNAVYKRAKNTLSYDADYCRLSNQRQTDWDEFCKKHPHETIVDVLNLIDNDGALADTECLAVLKLGFHLGYALGQTNKI